MPEVSIIIPAYKRPDLLRRCVESIRKTPADIPYEIVVVANGQEVLDCARQLHAERSVDQVAALSENRKFSVAVNIGAIMAFSPFLLFLNDDAWVVQHEWLKSLVVHLDLCGCISVTPVSLHSQEGRKDTIYWIGWDEKANRHRHHGESFDGRQWPPVIETPWNNMACMLTKWEHWEEAGPIEHRKVEHYGSDSSWGHKASSLGKHHVLTSVTVYHDNLYGSGR